MDKGQAGVAIGLIVTLVVVVCGIVAFAVIQQNNSSPGAASPAVARTSIAPASSGRSSKR